jgi:hypothetical protein
MIRADRKNDSRRPKVGFGKTERMSTKASIPPEEEELDKAHRGGLPLFQAPSHRTYKVLRS